MSNYALIQNDVVINVIVCDPSVVKTIDFGAGITAVEYDDGTYVTIGSTYDVSTNTFNAPETSPS